ncbi:MAG: PTS sugar transporter subunit IIA, partial [Planctomycetes bacterium]|nr:PTS sugar transporter subunit IIA [Planctomycetota bacterium]
VFGLGEEMYIERIKKAGKNILIIAVVQVFCTFALISFLFYLVKFSVINALLIGTISVATAPVALFILINKMGIEGDLRYKTATLVVVGNVIQIIMFSVFVQIAMSLDQGSLLLPTKIVSQMATEIILAMGLGLVVFLCLKLFVKETKIETTPAPSTEKTGLGFLRFIFEETPTPSVEIFLVILGIVCAGSAIAWNMGMPFLITCLTAGMLVANFHTRRIFDTLFIGNITPIINLIFFALVGASIKLTAYNWSILFYVSVYLLGRGAGKYFGTKFGCQLTRQDLKITRYLPVLMLPQAGLAAVQLVFLETALPKSGELIFQIVIPAMLVFEVGGIMAAEQTLKRWKLWVVGEKDALQGRKVLDQEKVLLHSVIKKNNIRIPLAASDKSQAINEMLDCLVENREIDRKAKTALFKQFMAREKIQSTGVGDGVAIPHIRTELTDKTICALGIKKDEGIDFESIDGQPVNIIFLFLSADRETVTHLKLLSEISFVLRKDENKKLIQGITNTQEAYDFFRNIKL